MGTVITESKYSLKRNIETFNKLSKAQEDLWNIASVLRDSSIDLEETAERLEKYIESADELIGVILYSIKLNVMTKSYKDIY